MTSYTFTPTGKAPKVGDWAMEEDGTLVQMRDDDNVALWAACPAYRRVESPACDGKVLEVATAIYAGRLAGGTRIGAIPECVADARALIAACKEGT